MKIVVLLKQVPDLVEDLDIDDSGTSLDYEYLKMKLNEFDDHALEEAILLKESDGAEVVAVAIDGDDVDKMLFTALAKGADKAVKITGADPYADNHALAKVMADAVSGMGADLVFTGVQSAGDRDGQLGPLMAVHLGSPSVSVITSVKASGNSVTIEKEYSGGVMAEFEVDMPAVLGIQAARQTPRYAPVSKVRQIQQSASLEEIAAGSTDGAASSTVTKIAHPEKGGGAKMLSDVDEIVDILKEKGVA
ncbi:MAG: electron transfer flavoprotein subunit beta/FixA family protein [Calditrichaeota bacterium]|nr:MAG: electron transfer flavoprotein subunit beta/FixA family protein [Calditrichota bacterium]MBL1207087.1 electron transfer flavoprotein subunit beta/FixA family protein [Calditrichota bacterium]NOG46917.1 electron transfer flavoprotein subunit beta/FixA family protein [Calditrichota bacterium]